MPALASRPATPRPATAIALIEHDELFPLPAAADPRIRTQLQALDARSASRTLAVAGLLSLNRATLLPWMVGHFAVYLPASELKNFAGYLDPRAAGAALALAIVFIATALLAGRRPLLAGLLALAIFLLVSAPFVLANPVLVGGGHLGRLVMGLIVLRAIASGMVYHAR